MTEDGTLSLCCPDDEKSCFACCPPIRAPGYEHLPYRKILQRELRENAAQFSRSQEEVSPITGFSCWALGYLDRKYRLVGCLLHPARNGGVDLRYRVHYGDKCRRESCREAKEFMRLEGKARRFWLRLCEGLDSFSYSSKRHNPLFSLLGWGSRVLGGLSEREGGIACDRVSFFRKYPFFHTTLNPNANAYLLDRLTANGEFRPLESEAFRARFEAFSSALSAQVRQRVPRVPGPVHTHLLELDRSFLDFLRLSAGIRKTDWMTAKETKEMVDKEISGFMPNIQRGG